MTLTKIYYNAMIIKNCFQSYASIINDNNIEFIFPTATWAKIQQHSYFAIAKKYGNADCLFL
jgi:hypothetical protein